MKKVYSLVLAFLACLVTLPMSAQDNKVMVLHMKDKSVQEIPVASIDSISFDKPMFDVSLDLHPLYVPYTIKPRNDAFTYNTMLVEKEIFDQYTSDEEIFQEDLKFFQEMADGWGMTLEDVLGEFILSGEFADIHSELLPDTEYVMWCYGMTIDGKRTTPIYKKVFKTSPVAKMIDNKVNVDITRAGGAIDATYTPDLDDMYYTAGIMHEADAIAETFIPRKVQKSISTALYDFVANGEPLSNYLEFAGSKKQTKARYEGVEASSTYFVLAAYLDNDCCICSPVTIQKSTPENTKSVTSTKSFLQKTTTVKRCLPARLQIKDQMIRLNK